MKILTQVTLMGLVAGALAFTGCSSNKLNVEEHVKNEQYANELEGAPAWVMSHPEDDNFVYGLGIASETKGNISFQRTVAMGKGRDEIARAIEVKVQNMLKTFQEKTGNIDNTTFDQVATNVSKQVANTTLMGSKQHKDNWWISKSGNLYLLVSMDKKNIANAIQKTTNSSFKNNEALWQKIQSEKAQKELRESIEAGL